MRWLVLSLALPSTALACPTSSDLPRGVMLMDNHETSHVFQTAGPNLVSETLTLSNGEALRNTFLYGSYQTVLSAAADGTHDQFTIKIDYAGTPNPPAANLRQRVNTTHTSEFDGQSSEVQTHIWGQPTQMAIGNCNYESIPGTLTYESSSLVVTENVSYLPALGVALLTQYADNEGGPALTFQFQSITAQ